MLPGSIVTSASLSWSVRLSLWRSAAFLGAALGLARVAFMFIAPVLHSHQSKSTFDRLPNTPHRFCWTSARVRASSLGSEDAPPDISHRSFPVLWGGNAGEGDGLTTTTAALSAFHHSRIANSIPDMTMAAANGTLTPPSLPPAPTSPSAAKRKLAGHHAIVSNGASASAQGQRANGNAYSLQAVLGDILVVLKRYGISACYACPWKESAYAGLHKCPTCIIAHCPGLQRHQAVLC